MTRERASPTGERGFAGRRTMPTPEAVARDVIKRLEAMADPRKARVAQSFFKEPVRVLGLSAPEVRAVAAEVHREVRDAWTADDAIALCDLMLPRPELEAKSVALLVLQRYRRSFPERLFHKTHKWLKADYLDNWASVDTCCPEIMGALLQTFPRLLHRIEAWAASPDRWVRRASLVSFIKLAKRKDRKRAIYAMARRHFSSDDDLIQKAAGWLLREVGKQDMEALARFLLRHGPRIPRTTLRYAIERFPLTRRRELLEKTRVRAARSDRASTRGLRAGARTIRSRARRGR
jgi:3-methyladenine DNA glycosylase AlkD